MGTQKNCLNETVLLGTQNICYKFKLRKYNIYYDHFFLYLGLSTRFTEPILMNTQQMFGYKSIRNSLQTLIYYQNIQMFLKILGVLEKSDSW